MRSEGSTTDLEEVRKQRRRFTWGRVLEIHDIGRYTLIEYIANPGRMPEPDPKPKFHVYVDGKDTCSGTATLDEGLVLAIAHGKLEVNEARWMARSILKLLVPSKD